MKNIKFSRLFAAVMVAACLAFVGCKQPEDETKKEVSIYGTWVSSYGEKYVITPSDYDNYSRYDANYVKHEDQWFLYYSTNNLLVKVIDKSSGIIFGQFDDANHLGSGANKGQWYALMYTDLKEDSVNLWQPWKEGGKAACTTVDEAVAEFTVDNGYFGSTSACTKQ